MIILHQPACAELEDAVPYLLVICLSVDDLTRFMNDYQRGKKFAQAWADLSMWFWQHPQNLKFN